MKHSHDKHHAVHGVALPILPRDGAVRPVGEVPTVEVYEKRAPAAPIFRQVKPTKPTAKPHDSMFSTNKRHEIKDDPFLERLSRLN